MSSFVELIPFDDGHIPGIGGSKYRAGSKSEANGNIPVVTESAAITREEITSEAERANTAKGHTKLAVNLNKAASNFVSVFDDVISDEWCDRVYSYAMQKKRPWGVYITSKEALTDTAEIDTTLLFNTDPEKAIGLEVTRALVFGKARDMIANDIDRIHGTVVWCLASTESDNVEYHIDYAELYRYETNVIHPPLYAGTCHVSPLRIGDMTGGEFMVNLDGIKHYSKFGYKGSKLPRAVLEEDFLTGNWMSVRYSRGRGIIHDGDFPHLSTRITRIFPPSVRRVILGLNCFSEHVGECCQRAPEHSDAFNRTVKLYQTLARVSNVNTEPASVAIESSEADSSIMCSSNNGPAEATAGTGAGTGAGAMSASSSQQSNMKRVTLAEVMKNPALAKLLVSAARKIKSASSGEVKESFK